MKYRRLYVTGDTHGEPGRFMYTGTTFEKMAGPGDILFIAGDFGFVWDNSPEEQAIREIITEKKYTTCFVDGNHENFDLLESYPVSQWCGGKVHVIGKAPDGTPKLIHLMRGQVYDIPVCDLVSIYSGSGAENTDSHREKTVSIFTMGGASSIDRKYRKEGESWWPREMPSPEEYAEALANLERHHNRVDYLLTHTGRERSLDIFFLGRRNPNEMELNHFLEQLHERVSFLHHYFGHLHDDADFTEKETLLWFQVRDMITNELIE